MIRRPLRATPHFLFLSSFVEQGTRGAQRATGQPDPALALESLVAAARISPGASGRASRRTWTGRKADGRINITNKGTDGIVIIDALQVLPAGQ